MTLSARPRSPAKPLLHQSAISDAVIVAAVIGGSLLGAGHKPVPQFYTRVIPLLIAALFVEAILVARLMPKREPVQQSHASAIFGGAFGAVYVAFMAWVILWAGWHSEVRLVPIIILALFSGVKRYWNLRKPRVLIESP